MSVNANCVANVRSDGNDSLNAGWFDTSSGDVAGGAGDRVFGNNPIVVDGSTVTATVQPTTTQIVISGASLATTDRGNVFRTSGGAYLRITAVNVGSSLITVDQSAGTSGATLTGRIGGAFASIGQVGATAVSGVNVWVKQHPGSGYVIGGTANVSGGRLDLSASANSSDRANPLRVEGYSNTYGDGGRATLLAGASSMNIFRGGSFVIYKNLIVRGNGNSNVTAFNTGWSSGSVEKCEVYDCAVGVGDSNRVVLECYFENCTTGVSNTSRALRCFANGCATGFGDVNAINCIAYGCTTTGFSCSSASAVGSIAYNCATGFWPHSGGVCHTCIAYGCTMGFKEVYGGATLSKCAAGGNTTNVELLSGASLSDDHVTLTADPFVNASGGDFRLTSSARDTLAVWDASLPSLPSTILRPRLAIAQSTGVLEVSSFF